jgi:hypothetical protein
MKIAFNGAAAVDHHVAVLFPVIPVMLPAICW